MTDPLNPAALAAEVASCNFGDVRLKLRLQRVVEAIAIDPSASFPNLFDSAGLEGAYRFFSNVHVTPPEILSGHFAATRSRCDEARCVLVVHDSTDFSYRVDGERQNLGRARTSNQTFYGHVSLVLAADGSRKPLGVLGVKTWTRTPERVGKERDRWLEEALAARARLGADTHVIHVMDREADDYSVFAGLIEANESFIIRGYHDRTVHVGDDTVAEKLSAVVATIEVDSERDASLTKRRAKRSPTKAKTHPARAARVAKLAVGAASLTMHRPKNLKSGPSSIDVNIVRVWETDPPEGEPPVEWMLITNEPIATTAELLAIVDHYRARWTIEEYFKALKTGCAFERRQLHDYESLINVLATFAPVAYQLLLLRSRARADPAAPATTVLSADEIEVLRELGRLPLPAAPTTREVMLAVAALGGHIKYAPDPGWLTLSRGYEKLAALTAGWVAAKVRLHSDQR